MEGRILKESGNRDISLIKELNLGSCKSSSVVGLSEEWKNLEKLILINVGLNTLKGFPRLPSLKKLELSENNLCEDFDALACLPKLEELDLSGNKIRDLEAFEPLSQVNTLKKLNLNGCDVCKVKNYREKLFNLIPSLVHLDGLDKEESEDEDVSDLISFVKKETEHTNGVNGEVRKEGCDDASPDEEEDYDDSLDEEDEDDDEEEDIPLEALYGKINDEGDDDDFEANEDEDDEDIEEEDDQEEGDASISVAREDPEETEEGRGTKRKLEQN